MDLIKLYKEVLKDTKIENVEMLYRLEIPIDNKLIIELYQEDVNKYNYDYKEPSYIFKIKILSYENRYGLFEQSINEEIFTELRKMTIERNVDLVFEFLNMKYVSFPQAPDSIIN